MSDVLFRALFFPLFKASITDTMEISRMIQCPQGATVLLEYESIRCPGLPAVRLYFTANSHARSTIVHILTSPAFLDPRVVPPCSISSLGLYKSAVL